MTVDKLPVRVRLCLAKLTLWRMRHGSAAWSTLLLLSIVVSSVFIGYLAGIQSPHRNALPDAEVVTSLEPVTGMAQPEPINRGLIERSIFPSPAHWGELQAQIAKLSVLFRRLARLGELDDPEFHLDVALGPDAPLNALASCESTPSQVRMQFALANSAVTHMSHSAKAMLSIYQQRHNREAMDLSGSPVEEGRISSVFGFRNDPRNGRRQFHRGVDYSGPKGSKVLALADGIVTYSGRNGGYGNLVELEHADGYRSRYAHNERNLVEVGRYVTKGQEIATMGSTGRSTGTHVHVEVRRHSKAVDPLLFIQ